MPDSFFQTPPPTPIQEPTRQQQVFEISSALERSLFTKVFTWMAGALLVTAITALLVASSSLGMLLLKNQILFWGLCIGELVLVGVMVGRIHRMSFNTAVALMAGYSILNGVTLSSIFMVFSLGSIARVFFITAGMFAVMAIIGSSIKRQLNQLSRILYMILIGLVITMVINLFLKSTALDWIMSIVGVVLFTILTAVDTNKIKHGMKELVENGADPELTSKFALLGSLTLYLDFINLFLYLLRLFGSRD